MTQKVPEGINSQNSVLLITLDQPTNFMQNARDCYICLKNPASIPMTSQINGKLWHDLNGNGFQDTFEPGIAGGTVYLDDNQNGKFDIGERSTLTDEDGNYTFSDLEAGTYIVAQTLAPGWH